MLSVEDVREYFDYDPDSGIVTWKKRASPRAMPGYPAGTNKGDGYVQIYLKRTSIQAHVIAWVLMTGAFPLSMIDHRDGDPTNNRWGNLRLATNRQNQYNRGAPKNNKWGFKGVSQDKMRPGFWRADIHLPTGLKFLGEFRSPEEAGAAYNAAAKEIQGEFARV